MKSAEYHKKITQLELRTAAATDKTRQIPRADRPRVIRGLIEKFIQGLDDDAALDFFSAVDFAVADARALTDLENRKSLIQFQNRRDYGDDPMKWPETARNEYFRLTVVLSKVHERQRETAHEEVRRQNPHVFGLV